MKRRRAATASALSTSTTWSRSRRSWKRPRDQVARSSSRPAAALGPTPTTASCYHLMLAAAEAVPRDSRSRMHQDHGNSPDDLQVSAIEMGFTSVMMDGSLMDDGKTPVQLRVQRRRSPRKSSNCAHAARRDGRGRTRAASGGSRRRPRRRAATPMAHLTDPDAGRRVRREDRRRCSRRRHRHQPRRVQVLARSPTGEVLAMKRIEEIHKNLPTTPPGDARLLAACRRSCRTSSTSTAAR